MRSARFKTCGFAEDLIETPRGKRTHECSRGREASSRSWRCDPNSQEFGDEADHAECEQAEHMRGTGQMDELRITEPRAGEAMKITRI
jgi:hypothetical protein